MNILYWQEIIRPKTTAVFDFISEIVFVRDLTDLFLNCNIHQKNDSLFVILCVIS